MAIKVLPAQPRGGSSDIGDVWLGLTLLADGLGGGTATAGARRRTVPALALPGGQRLAHVLRPGLSLSPDGRSSVFLTGEPDASVFGGPRPSRRSGGPYAEARGWEELGGTGEGDLHYPTFSPDSRWLTFLSNESGRPEVLVNPLRTARWLAAGVGRWWRPAEGDLRRKLARLKRRSILVPRDRSSRGNAARLFGGCPARTR